MALIVLTNRCNLSCDTCFRPRGAGSERPWLLHELEERFIEIAAVGHSSVFYSGGEPSLWSDGSAGFADLLAATTRHGLSAAFATNGWAFNSYEKASRLLDRYLNLTDAPLYVVVSVDCWHKGSWVEGRSPALDAILQWRDAHASPAHLEVELSSLCSVDETRNIPRQDFARYAEAGVTIQYLPISPRGRADKVRHLAPALRPSGTSKESMGPYSEILRAKLGFSAEQWEELDNADLLGPCHSVTTMTLGMDRQYWLCNGRAGGSLRVAVAGELTKDRIAECLDRNPLVSHFRQSGFAQTLHQCELGAGPLDAHVIAPILVQQHPFCVSARASCGLCKSLPQGEFH